MASGKGNNGQVASCPACGSEIFLRKRPRRGQLITCRVCDSLLETVSIHPLELEWAFEDSLDDYYRDRRGNQGDYEDWDIDEFEEFDSFEDFPIEEPNDYEDRTVGTDYS